MKLGDVKDLAVLGALAGGVYLVTQALGGARKGYDAAVNATSDALWAVFGPSDESWNTTNYLAWFPDGKLHQVTSNKVGKDGTFINTGDGYNYKGDGKRYRLLVDKKGNAGYRAVLVA